MSFLSKMKEFSNITDEEKTQTSFETEQPKSEEEIKKDKINQFLAKLDDVAWDLNDDSSFFNDCWSQKREKKLENACKAYGKGRNLDPILLVDTTTFGKAEQGMMFTRDGIYMGTRGDSARYKSYTDIFGRNFKTREGSFYINNSEYEFLATSQMKKLKPVINLLNNYFSS